MTFLVLIAAAAASASVPVRPLEFTDGPLFHSSAADLIHAWQDCASAVEGRDLKADEAVLKDDGWIPTRVIVRGKTIGEQFYSRPDVNALIRPGEACLVEGLADDGAIVPQLQTAIAKRVTEIAARRGTKFETWTADAENARFFSAKPFTAAIYFPTTKTLVEAISGNPGATTPIKILTVDATRSEK